MRQPFWQRKGNLASLQAGSVQATVDVARPDQGLVELRVAGVAWRAARLLGIAAPRLAGTQSGTPGERFVQGDDLSVAYCGLSNSPVQVDAVWRVVEAASPQALPVVIDFVVSVRTELLQSQPEVIVETCLPSIALRGLPAGPGGSCTLFRHPQAACSYAEMILPVDFRGDEVQLVDEPNSVWRLSHHLFPHSLEKGVILRVRLRGVFLPAADDERLAAECYAAFAQAEPPLDA